MQAGKSRRFIIMSIASMLMVLSCLGHGWAQFLDNPIGLALDARGNLYVANAYSNQVLVYNPNYVQQPTKSITTGLSYPVGVAFDSKGNVYVCNGGGIGFITQYSSAGVQNTRFSITDGIANPWAIAVDAVDDLWVSNSGDPGTITVYPLADTINGPFLLTTYAASDINYGIAAHAGDLYIGLVSNWQKGFISELLAGGGRFPVVQSANSVTALTTDSAGDLYDSIATGTGEVDFWGPKGGHVFLQLSFQPAGIAVDSARGRVYLSNQQGNQVLVYSTKRTLLHTIQ